MLTLSADTIRPKVQRELVCVFPRTRQAQLLLHVPLSLATSLLLLSWSSHLRDRSQARREPSRKKTKELYELVRNRTTSAPHEYVYQCELYSLLSWAFTCDIGETSAREWIMYSSIKALRYSTWLIYVEIRFSDYCLRKAAFTAFSS